MKVTGRDAASTRIHDAKIAKKARPSQPAAAAASQSNPAATPRGHVNSSALFPHQDDAFEDFSDCGPRAIGATGPEDAERYSRTAAWVEEFHDDGWGDAFADIVDAGYMQLTTPQSTYLPDFPWDATTESGLLDLHLPVGNAAPFCQQQQEEQDHIYETFNQRTSVSTQKRQQLQNKQHNPRCRAAWGVSTAECDCAQLSRQARLDSLTEEMRRFTREHGAYQPEK